MTGKVWYSIATTTALSKSNKKKKYYK